MSKKFGINTKSAEAKARKDVVKQSNDRDKQQKLDEEYWRDDDKQGQKKQQRKEERDKKDEDKTQRKQEIQKLLEQEEVTLAATKAKKIVDLAPKKLTQAQIQQQQQNAATANPVNEPKRNNINNQEDLPIEENINRLKIDGASARNVDDALQVLQSSQVYVDSHPEKRMKAAFDTYEAENLPKLKQEHPSLRLSQLKQLLKKEWMKSPDNPFNKPTVAYNEKSDLKQNTLPQLKDSDEDDDN